MNETRQRALAIIANAPVTPLDADEDRRLMVELQQEMETRCEKGRASDEPARVKRTKVR